MLKKKMSGNWGQEKINEKAGLKRGNYSVFELYGYTILARVKVKIYLQNKRGTKDCICP